MQSRVLDRPLIHEAPVVCEQEVETPSEIDKRTGEDVRNEFTKLWNIYTGRRAGLSLEIGNQVVEDDVLATRYFHERAIEETYWRTRTYEYGGHLKGGMKQTEVLFINISTEFYDQEIHVDEVGEVHVRVLDRAVGEWYELDAESASGIVNSFFDRAEWAAMMHTARTPEERQRADNESIGLLYNRYPVLADATATLE